MHVYRNDLRKWVEAILVNHFRKTIVRGLTTLVETDVKPEPGLQVNRNFKKLRSISKHFVVNTCKFYVQQILELVSLDLQGLQT